MKRDRKAPDEPDFGVKVGPEDRAAGALNLGAQATGLISVWNEPAPETELPSDRERASTDTSAPTSTRRARSFGPPLEFPILDRIEKLSAAGNVVRALVEIDDLCKRLEQEKSLAVEDQLLWARAKRLALNIARQAQQTGSVSRLLKGMKGHFEGKSWQAFKTKTAGNFNAMFALALKMERFDDALSIYARGRDYIELTPAQNQKLARLAASRQRTDLGAAQLYLRSLDSKPNDDAVLRHMRRAIRIDLIHPAERLLDELRDLNTKVLERTPVPWARAHLAMAALRTNQVAEAVRQRRLVIDVSRLDAETLRILATASYVGRDWTDAQQLFLHAAEQPDAESSLLTFYSALCQLHQLHDGDVACTNAEDLHMSLAARLGEVRDHRPLDARALDADCVLGLTLFLCGNDEEALKAFGAADPLWIRWEHWQVQMEAMLRLGRRDQLTAAIERWSREFQSFSVWRPLVKARESLSRDDSTGARGEIAAAEMNVESWPKNEATFPAAVQGFRMETALLLVATAERVIPVQAITSDAAGLVRAWIARLECFRHLQEGRVDQALACAADPILRLAAPSETTRLDAVLLAWRGRFEEARAKFAHLADIPSTQPVNRLEYAACLLALQEPVLALEQLRAIDESFQQTCPESRLTEAECLLETGADVTQVQEALRKLKPPGRWAEDPLRGFYRVWTQQQALQSDQEPQANWAIWRVGDLLHAAHLMIRARLIAEAQSFLIQAETELGAPSSSAQHLLGLRYQAASVVALESAQGEGDFNLARDLHGKAEQFGHGEADFSVRLVLARLRSSEYASDSLLEDLHAWLTKARLTLAEFEAGALATALRSALFMDEETPESNEELERRERWTRTFQELMPDWDWLKQNLMRAAVRGERFAEVIDWVHTLPHPTSSDRYFQGLAHWRLHHWNEAQAAFLQSQELGMNTTALQACARAVPAVSDFDLATPHEQTNWRELLDALTLVEVPTVFVTAVQFWRGVILLLDRQFAACEEALLPISEDERLGEVVQVLRGLALVQAGRADDAWTLWRFDLAGPKKPLQHSIACLVRWHTSPRRARAAILDKDLVTLRREGINNALFQLAEANHYLDYSDLSRARQALDRAQDFAELRDQAWLALRPFLHFEQRFVEARWAIQQGDFASGLGQLAALEVAPCWPTDVRYLHAMGKVATANVAGGRDLDQAEDALRALTEDAPICPEAHVQLALLRIRTGRWEAARLPLERAQRHDPEDPFTWLARAEWHQARGDRGTSASLLEDLLSKASFEPGSKSLAACWLFQGRLQQEDGRHEDAAASYRQAAAICPRWPAPRLRLGLLLAQTAQEPQPVDTREQALVEAAELAPNDHRLLLAHALHRKERIGELAHAADNSLVQARCLNSLIANAAFATFPIELQHGVLMWTVQVNLQADLLSEAWSVFERLKTPHAEAATSELADLTQLELAFAIRRLRQDPLPAGALEQAQQTLEHALASDPDNPMLVLLTAACRLLQTQAADNVTHDLLKRLDSVEFPSEGLRRLLTVARWLALPEGLEKDLDTNSVNGLDPLAEHALRLLKANKKDKPDLNALIAAGAECLEGNAVRGPFAADDLVLLLTLQRWAANQRPAARDVLRRWHASAVSPTKSMRTRHVHATLIARDAIQKLNAQQTHEAVTLLKSAIALMNPSAGE